MLNYWWVSRPKRKLDSVPDVLKAFVNISLDQEWEGQREAHLAYETALESAGLKKNAGKDKEQTKDIGSGGRTYKAWLMSLGLIYTEKSSGQIKITQAGEAILRGESPISILTKQILKYQFPSSFSSNIRVQVASRFHIRPFIFLLKLLLDYRITYISQEELAKIIVVEAENETGECYEYIVSRILLYRKMGDKCLDSDFFLKYQSSKGGINLEHPYSHLMDLANTLMNWLEYTQLVKREAGRLYSKCEKRGEIAKILREPYLFIENYDDQELFQKMYGTIKHLEIDAKEVAE